MSKDTGVTLVQIPEESLVSRPTSFTSPNTRTQENPEFDNHIGPVNG